MVNVNCEFYQTALQKEEDKLQLKIQEIQNFKAKEKEFLTTKHELDSIRQLLSSKLGKSEENKENKGINMNSIVNTDQIESKLTQLLKYKVQYKKIKESQRDNEFLKQ